MNRRWTFLRREPKKKAFIIVNPAAGQGTPNLKQFNKLFQKAGWIWNMEVTQAYGDGRAAAQRAVAQGYSVVAAYGGDGTVMDVAAGLAGTDIPLAILPGGTGNSVALEMGVPILLHEALRLIVHEPHTVRCIDVGWANGNPFLLRLGIGFEALAVQVADRSAKDRWGLLAYVMGTLAALNRSQMSNYRIEVDGKVEETEGLACTIANAATIGIPGLVISPSVRMDDGLLDLFLMRKGDLNEFTSLAASLVSPQTVANPLPHWSGREITISADPPQSVEADGDVITRTPLNVVVQKQGLGVIVPSRPGIFARPNP